MHSRGITGRKSLPLPSGFAFSRHAITFIPRLSSAACNFSAKLSFPNSATQAGSGSSLGSGSACSCGSPLSGYHRVICPCALVRNFHLLTTKQNQKHAPGFRATSNDCVSTMYIYIYISTTRLYEHQPHASMFLSLSRRTTLSRLPPPRHRLLLAC